PHRALGDSAAVRALLDSADDALDRAGRLLAPSGSTPDGDSARVLRVAAWSARSHLAWEQRGINVGPQEWGPVPLDLKMPPVLDELGENLLRACPMWGVLLTANEADSYAAWYMRFARGLRPDLLTVPLAAWRSDSVLRGRIAADLKLGRHRDPDATLAELAKRRPVCVTVAFDRPPGPRIGWSTRPLLWVAGPHLKDDRVPPRDFVFAALRLALDDNDAWAQPALALYARAARAMGDKTEARRRMQAAGVPIVPGTTRPVADHVQAKSEAARLGLPVLLKAIAGGGGKGMRLIREEGELESAFETAQSEALKA